MSQDLGRLGSHYTKHLTKRLKVVVVSAWALLLGLTLSAAGGCTPMIPPQTFKHVVMINGRGNPVDPERSHNQFLRFFKDYEKFPSDDAYKKHFGRVLDAMERCSPEKCVRNGKRQVLIFVHGGLNTQTGTIERAAELYEPILRSGYYPIFINWQSSLLSSYRDHLLFIRQGKWRDWGPVLAPLYLIADVVRGIGRAPLTWVSQFENDLESFMQLEDSAHAEPAFEELEIRYKQALAQEQDGHPEVIAISRGEEERGSLEMTVSGLQYAVTIPTKLLIAPLIDAMGTSAWDIMLRRTHMLFYKEGEFGEHASKVDVKPEGEGGLSVFLRALGDRVKANSADWEITLVGHSMGTIVLNEMLRRFPKVHFSNIVYMGAASTVRDYEDSVFPYLTAHSGTHFYHLMLHNKAEVRERWEKFPIVVDLPPRGSLLVWIDNFLSKPETALDRTLGRWTNLVVALHHTPSDLRERIHVKAFSVGNRVRTTDPQEHSDLATFPFWKRPNWEPKDHR